MRNIIYAITASLLVGSLFVATGRQAPADPAVPQRGYTLVDTGDVGGIWVQRPSGKVCATLHSNREDRAILGFFCDVNKSKGCDFAISADRDGVVFQVRDEAGKFHQIPATALLKLVEKPKVEKGD